MPEQKSKLDVFVQSILEESSEEVHRILGEFEAQREKAVSEMTLTLKDEVARYKATRIAEIEAAQSRRVSSRMVENKQELLLYRENCAREVFELAQQQINEFTASGDYLDCMKKLLRRGTAALGDGFSADLLLRAEDMKLSEALQSSVEGGSLRVSEGNFLLGGLRLVCHERGLRIDMSFDSVLGDYVGHFSEISGMHIDE